MAGLAPASILLQSFCVAMISVLQSFRLQYFYVAIISGCKGSEKEVFDCGEMLAGGGFRNAADVARDGGFLF